MDTISKQCRSWNMSRIRSKNTSPELRVRRSLRKAGIKFRAHDRALPGNPDFVLYDNNAVIFIHGCFWHHHNRCSRASWPKSNREYWIPKIKRNVLRDKSVVRLLKKIGWRVIILWECQTKQDSTIFKKVNKIYELLQ
jgi:DNA mismatch endonuclease, patch repair protein